MNQNMTDKSSRPFVFVRCITYNHEPYIEDALKGFVMQKTDFPFLAVVIDDCSTDGTADIVRRYEAQYPNIIKGIYLPHNFRQTREDKRPYYQEYVDMATYWAECEGDDYWTDPYKLQKQVDILEADETLMLCCTNSLVVDKQGNLLQESRDVVKDNIEGRYNLRDYFQDNHQYPTLSVVFRTKNIRRVRELLDYTRNPFLSDWTMWICLMIDGDMYYINEVTCAYRINPTSITHSNVDVRRLGLAKANFKLLPAVASILPDKYQDIKDDLTKNTAWMWYNLANAYRHVHQYFHMTGCLLVCAFKNPKFLYGKFKRRK